jgi:hypothetical protein
MSGFTYNQEDFENVREKAESLYQNLETAPCSYFNGEKILFNAKGI